MMTFHDDDSDDDLLFISSAEQHCTALPHGIPFMISTFVIAEGTSCIHMIVLTAW